MLRAAHASAAMTTSLLRLARFARRAAPAVAAVAGVSSVRAARADAPPAPPAGGAPRRAATASGWRPARKLRVGVLGATGAVGQRFVAELAEHPWFELARVGASERSRGKRYADAAAWGLSSDCPAYAADMTVVGVAPEDFAGVDCVFSALDASVALDVEPAFAAAGIPVFSNASAHRMAPDVPLVVPPVNGGHLDRVRAQAAFARGGYIVTNANCSTTGLVIALKPLVDAFGVAAVSAVTLQAVSGAGYPGLPSLDILDNVIPFIGGEEAKLESEYAKILGSYEGGAPGAGGALRPAPFPLSAAVNRVHVRDGHSIALSVRTARGATAGAAAAALAAWAPEGDVASLPSAPAAFIRVRPEQNRPQPRLDRDEGRGYTTVVGRVRDDAVLGLKMQVLSHNTVMGAAGSSILNAELAARMGLLPPPTARARA